jgi:intracellular sulfur oxidation DsrE/DsrF family protein
MPRLHVTQKELLPLAPTVDSGTAEVVRKQEAGWSYLRSG